MPEPKTRPTDVDPAEFVAAVPDAKRRAEAYGALGLLAEISGEPAVMWGPSIVGFGSYRGDTGDWPRLGFSPRRAETVFYLTPGFEKTEAFARLGPARTGVSCLYIKRLDAVDEGALRDLVRWSLDRTDERYPK